MYFEFLLRYHSVLFLLFLIQEKYMRRGSGWMVFSQAIKSTYPQLFRSWFNLWRQGIVTCILK
jgi:hypothetical protein